MTEQAVRVAYFLRIPNVGDRASPMLVEALSGRCARHTADPQTPHLLTVGSLMAGANPLSVVWGAGVMHPDIGVGHASSANIFALRGPLSHRAIRGTGIDARDVPLGDPGILAPEALGIRRKEIQFPIGLVPHYVDRENPHVHRIGRQEGVTVLNVHDAPEAFLEAMASCGAVLSTSLHGLVFAEALGIPNLWIQASDDIAGAGFKFHDWFATTGRPQTAPHLLSTKSEAVDLARQAELHESAIDKAALRGAFPHQRLDDCTKVSPKALTRLRQCRRRALPVFLISFNRAELLQRCIAGVNRQRRRTEIVIHDNGSDEPQTLALLDRLTHAGVRVYRRAPISTVDELNLVDETVRDFFSDWSEPARYIVSDCDIDMSVASPDAFDLFDDLLNTHRHIECAGPMLRIRDIPRTYPLFNHVLNRHIHQFWRHTPSVRASRFGEIAYLQGFIDTTLALHRAGEPFKRMKTAIRVYEPFEALHLDWYRAGPDAYTITSSPGISHWNNAIEQEAFRAEPMKFEAFKIARQRADGAIEIIEVPTRQDQAV